LIGHDFSCVRVLRSVAWIRDFSADAIGIPTLFPLRDRGIPTGSTRSITSS
jgi:hypothetical protein